MIVRHNILNQKPQKVTSEHELSFIQQEGQEIILYLEIHNCSSLRLSFLMFPSHTCPFFSFQLNQIVPSTGIASSHSSFSRCLTIRKAFCLNPSRISATDWTAADVFVTIMTFPVIVIMFRLVRQPGQ